jgi:hypothetical protein
MNRHEGRALPEKYHETDGYNTEIRLDEKTALKVWFDKGTRKNKYVDEFRVNIQLQINGKWGEVNSYKKDKDVADEIYRYAISEDQWNTLFESIALDLASEGTFSEPSEETLRVIKEELVPSTIQRCKEKKKPATPIKIYEFWVSVWYFAIAENNKIGSEIGYMVLYSLHGLMKHDGLTQEKACSWSNNTPAYKIKEKYYKLKDRLGAKV